MDDAQAAKLRELAGRAGDPHAEWFKARIDLAMEFLSILALLDTVESLRRERDDRDDEIQSLRREAVKLIDERDAAMALLQRRGRALVAIESIARQSETAIVLPNIARIAADAILGDGAGGA